MAQGDSRADALRLRVFRVLGHGGVTQIARGLGKDRSYISQILNGQGVAAPTLDAIEKYLDSLEKEAA